MTLASHFKTNWKATLRLKEPLFTLTMTLNIIPAWSIRWANHAKSLLTFQESETLSVKQKIGQHLELVKTSEIQSLLTFDQTTPHPLLNTNQQSPQFVTWVRYRCYVKCAWSADHQNLLLCNNKIIIDSDKIGQKVSLKLYYESKTFFEFRRTNVQNSKLKDRKAL